MEKDYGGQSAHSPHGPHAQAALAWLRRSIEATGGQGSAHSYSPLFGWAKAYPETTGYLIPTLLRYAYLLHDDSLRDLAHSCRDWLLRIQLPNGAWAGGVAGGTKPSVFNTAMILWGMATPLLLRVNPTPNPSPTGRGDVACAGEYAMEDAKGYSTPLLPVGEGSGVGLTRGQFVRVRLSPTPEAGVSWLLSELSPDGAWRNGAYVPGFVPSYYTYAVWSLLETGALLGLAEVPERMRTALHFYARRFRPDGTVTDWGLKPGDRAFTHTIAYTLQGFLESALQLGEEEILEKTLHATEGLLVEFERTNRIAGRYGPGWRGDYSFTCPVGNAQLSIFFRRMWETTGVEKFDRAADVFLSESLRFQNFGKNPNTHGALPGSAPFWGPYLRGRYPNWGVKFLMDALAFTLPPPVREDKPSALSRVWRS